MTVCMWVNLLRDHAGAWHLLATKWNDDGVAGDKYFFHFGIQDTVLNLYLSDEARNIRRVGPFSGPTSGL